MYRIQSDSHTSIIGPVLNSKFYREKYNRDMSLKIHIHKVLIKVRRGADEATSTRFVVSWANSFSK